MSSIRGDVLPECQVAFTDLRLTVALIEHDIVLSAKVIDKLSEAVEKIEEMNANLVKIIAVHDLKHENTTEDVKELERRIDDHRLSSVTTTTTENDAKKTLEQLKKWQYMIFGGAIVVGWVISHLKWPALLSLFGIN